MGKYNVKIIEYESNREVEFRLYKKPIVKNKKPDEEPPDEELIEPPDEELIEPPDEEKKQRKARSLEESMRRTKQMIYSHARANRWQWFVTYTFDTKKIDSTNYDEVYKYLSSHLKNIRKRKCPNMKYIIVPEYHSDGKKFHFHALMSDIDELEFKDSGKKAKGKIIYNIKSYKAGYTTAVRIGEEESARTSNYMCKYITKTLVNLTENRQRYLVSQNLDTPVETELLIDNDELEELRKELHEKTTSAKVVSIDCGSYQNQVEYLQIKL